MIFIYISFHHHHHHHHLSHTHLFLSIIILSHLLYPLLYHLSLSSSLDFFSLFLLLSCLNSDNIPNFNNFLNHLVLQCITRIFNTISQEECMACIGHQAWIVHPLFALSIRLLRSPSTVAIFTVDGNFRKKEGDATIMGQHTT